MGLWLRRIDIQDGLLSAAFALARQILYAGRGKQFQKFSFPADRADCPSVLCVYLSTFVLRFQGLTLTFYTMVQLLRLVSRF